MTAFDRDIARLVAEGLSSGVIARRLNASRSLVEERLSLLDGGVEAAGEAEDPVVVAPVPSAPPRSCCQWPLWGHKERPDGRYCAAPVVSGRSWCAAHCAQAFVKPAVDRSKADRPAKVRPAPVREKAPPVRSHDKIDLALAVTEDERAIAKAFNDGWSCAEIGKHRSLTKGQITGTLYRMRRRGGQAA